MKALLWLAAVALVAWCGCGALGLRAELKGARAERSAQLAAVLR